MIERMKVLEQYAEALREYCLNQKTCQFCAFRTVEDEIGDGCPFYVIPNQFDMVFPPIIINAKETAKKQIDLVEE